MKASFLLITKKNIAKEIECCYLQTLIEEYFSDCQELRKEKKEVRIEHNIFLYEKNKDSVELLNFSDSEGKIPNDKNQPRPKHFRNL